MLEIKDQENEYTKLTPRVKVTVLVLVLLIIFSLVYFSKPNSTKNNLLVVSEDTSDLTLEDQLYALNRRSKIVVPTLASKKEISSKDLPLNIITMIGPNVTYNSIESNAYETGSNGYEVDFIYPKPFRDTYFSFLNNFRNEKWTVIYGSRYEDSGIFNVENEEYTARITLSKIDAESVMAKALIINKK